MKEREVTNYIISCKGKWSERYILPPFRGRMKELIDKMVKLDCEPLLVIGKDGMWWNDELYFVLDRMSDGECFGKDDPLFNWAKEIENHPLKVGEVREMRCGGNTFVVTASTTDLSNDGLMSNDCKPIEE